MHGTFCCTDHMFGHEVSLSKFKKIEIIPHIFSDHNGMKQKSTASKKKKENLQYMGLKNIPLNNQWVKEEIKMEIKKYLDAVIVLYGLVA